MDKILFSKKCDDWATPLPIYRWFMGRGFVDPCPLNSIMDNLSYDFSESDLFINPPYSNISKWVDFAIENHLKGNLTKNIVLLIPSRTDTKYFHRLMQYGCEFSFFKGRLKFGGSKNSAPFPSVLVFLKGKGINTILEVNQDYYE